MKLSTQILLAFMLVLLLSVFDTGANYLLSLKVEKNTIFLTRSHEVIRNSTGLHKKNDRHAEFIPWLFING